MSELQNPFIGLQSYGPDDSHKLFGRDRDLILMKDRIFSARTTLLFAGSGVGKTSFLSAKIIPDLKAQYRPFYHNRWAGPDTPLDAIKKTLAEEIDIPENDGPLINCFKQFRKNGGYNETDGEPVGFEDTELETPQQDTQCLLILDQFEEIFQYHAYEDYFKHFLNELCEVIRAVDYRVHVVFSMREEFLGELSVFDNLIPDLFNNYYRLKYPDKREARNIIESTCLIAEAKVHKENLGVLIRDLSKIEKGVAAAAERSTQGDNARNHIVERSFIIPPYLQIVCRRQWEKQANSTNGNPNDFIFLEDYKENDAQKVLTEFCHEKLSGLTFMEQNVAEQSFDFLVTKQGAKMAYEFMSLVEHMRLRFFKGKLRKALDKLSGPESRILRRSHGPDGSVWFELYHDLYGKILDAWKPLFRRRKRKVALLLTIAVLALFVAIWIWGVNPYRYKRILRSVQLEEPESFIKANDAYRNLSETFGYRGSANSLMAEAWERRAEYSEKHNERDAALVSWLRALELDPNGPPANHRRLKAANLISDDYPRLRQSLRHENDVERAIFSDDGKIIVTQTKDQRLWIWDSQTGKLLEEYSNVDFRPNESQVSEVESSRTRPAARVDQSSEPNRQGDNSSGASSPEQTEIGAAAAHNHLGWVVAVSPQAEHYRLHKSYVALDDGRLRYSSIPLSLLWRGGEVVSSNIDIGMRVSGFLKPRYKVAFNRSGNLIATTGKGERTRVWSLAERKGMPVDGFRTPAFITDVVFSPDGRWLLFVGEGNRLFVWDVESRKLQFTTRLKTDPLSCRFSISGNSFLCLSFASPIVSLQVWNTETGIRQGTEIAYKVGSERVLPHLSFTADDRIFRIEYSNSSRVDIVDTGKREIGVETRFNFSSLNSSVFSPDGALALTILENEARLHTISLEQPSGAAFNAGGIVTEAVLTEDGSRVITLVEVRPDNSVEANHNDTNIASSTVKIWDANTLTQMGDSIDDIITVSSNGKYIAKLERERLPKVGRQNSEAPTNGYSVQILDTTTRVQVFRFECPGTTELQRLVSSPTGRFVASVCSSKAYRPDQEFEIQIWDRNAPSSSIWSAIKTEGYPALTFSSDERFFGVSSNSSYGVILWDLQLKQRLELEKNLAEAGEISFNESGLLIAGASKRVRTWELATRQPRYKDIDVTRQPTAVGISADGKTVLVGDSEGNVSLWSMEAPSRLGELRHKGYIQSLTFSDNGQTGIITTPGWLHTLNAGNHEYLASYFLGPNWLNQCRNVDAFGSKFRCLFGYPRGVMKVKNIQHGEITDTVRLDGEPHTLLDMWTKRLGLTIDKELGRIVPVVAGGASNKESQSGSSQP